MTGAAYLYSDAGHFDHAGRKANRGPLAIVSTRERDGGCDDRGDEALMADIAAEGSRAAFAVLVNRHLRKSVALARRVVGSASDAEEVVQDAFLQVWNHADDWRGNGTRFTTWLYRIVVNRALDYRRRRGFASLDEAGEVADPEPDAHARAEGRQLAGRIEDALAELPDRQRAALSLCYHEELSCAEAARVMQISVSAMESLLVRARRALRLRLGDLVGAQGRGENP
jgi:RNA polymerase sigma-70 factor (ECF subfamily)